MSGLQSNQLSLVANATLNQNPCDEKNIMATSTGDTITQAKEELRNFEDLT